MFEGIKFANDPMGYILEKAQESVVGLLEDALPALMEHTRPDLSADWFVEAYKLAFGFAVALLAFILIGLSVAVARRQMSGSDLLNTMAVYVPLFVLGGAFGPLFGVLLTEVFGAISDDLAVWGINGTTKDLVAHLSRLFAADDIGNMAGGELVAIIMCLCMMLAVIATMVILVVQLVTLYFAGVLFPLALVWILNPKTRKFARRGATVYLGILVAHALLFFMLALAFRLIINQSMGWVGEEDNPFIIFVNLGSAIVAIALALIAPAGLTAIGKMVVPSMAGTGGVSMSSAAPSSGSPSSGRRSGTDQATDSDTAGSSDGSSDGGSVSDSVDNGSSSTASSGGSGASESGGSPSGGVSTGQSVSRADLAGESGTTKATGDNDTADKTEAGVDSASGGPSEGSPASGATAADSTGAAADASSAAGAGGATAGAAEGAAAAGAAETATGAGAVVGIPTLVAAGAVMAAQKATQVADVAADSAVQAAEVQEG